MIWLVPGMKRRELRTPVQKHLMRVGTLNSLLRQEADLSFVKKEQWTEEEVFSLPAGEHDYFERKSGQLFDDPTDRNNLYDVLAKAACAFANSGGGHLILGIKDDGNLDGVPSVLSGRTPTRAWLEQKLPNLLDYSLGDFRVHTVVASAQSAIPPDRKILVIDIGDSALAPHQSRRHLQYFYRSAGRSIPAPHFYLELLRGRLTNAALDFKLLSVTPESAWLHEGALFLRIDAKFLIENKGRIAAYKWSLISRQIGNIPEERGEDYLFSGIPGAPGRMSSIRVDDAILPGAALNELKTFGVRLRPADNDEHSVRADLLAMLGTLSLTLQLATETSPGQSKAVDIGAVFSIDQAIELIRQKGLIEASASPAAAPASPAAK
jgi:Putative DNA-binding domain